MRWAYSKCVLVFKCLHNQCPEYMANLLTKNRDVHSYNTRNKDKFQLNKHKTNSGIKTFAFSASKLYNNLPSNVTSAKLTCKFKNLYWKHILNET